jgi:5-(carboxyamino)imidazole ribonucleotide mutase
MERDRGGRQPMEAVPTEQPLVGVIMGSDSDLPVMQGAAVVLEELQVSYEVRVISAHRTPDAMYQYAIDARGRGLKVIIAGAGGAAHLPGMTASLTHLPVIGVPVESRSLKGTDSLLSIVQMPPGVPVATVAINAARNAGILAAEILATLDEGLAQRVHNYKNGLRDMVREKDDRLNQLGYKAYLESMGK